MRDGDKDPFASVRIHEVSRLFFFFASDRIILTVRSINAGTKLWPKSLGGLVGKIQFNDFCIGVR